MIFADLPAATEYLADTVEARVAGAKCGYSNQSCSAYVRVSPTDENGDYLLDDDGEEVADREVRFSNHADRNPSAFANRITINLTPRAEELSNDDGDFAGFEIADWWIAETIDAAVAHLKG